MTLSVRFKTHGIHLAVFLFGQIILVHNATAQMYQWADPQTGVTQLSGSPPAWYRSVEGGPRVFVFKRGAIIDDTAIIIGDEQRIVLRDKAFNNIADNYVKSHKTGASAAPDSADDDVKLTDDMQQQASGGISVKHSEEKTVIMEKMKELIVNWENERAKAAKLLLEQEEN